MARREVGAQRQRFAEKPKVAEPEISSIYDSYPQSFPAWCASGVPWRISLLVSLVITLHYITLLPPVATVSSTLLGTRNSYVSYRFCQRFHTSLLGLRGRSSYAASAPCATSTACSWRTTDESDPEPPELPEPPEPPISAPSPIVHV